MVCVKLIGICMTYSCLCRYVDVASGSVWSLCSLMILCCFSVSVSGSGSGSLSLCVARLCFPPHSLQSRFQRSHDQKPPWHSIQTLHHRTIPSTMCRSLRQSYSALQCVASPLLHSTVGPQTCFAFIHCTDDTLQLHTSTQSANST